MFSHPLTNGKTIGDFLPGNPQTLRFKDFEEVMRKILEVSICRRNSLARKRVSNPFN